MNKKEIQESIAMLTELSNVNAPQTITVNVTLDFIAKCKTAIKVLESELEAIELLEEE